MLLLPVVLPILFTGVLAEELPHYPEDPTTDKDVDPVWVFSNYCGETEEVTGCFFGPQYWSAKCPEGFKQVKSEQCYSPVSFITLGQKLTCTQPKTQPCPCGQECKPEDYMKETLQICKAWVSGRGIKRLMDCTMNSVYNFKKGWDNIRWQSPLAVMDVFGWLNGSGFGTKGVSFIVNNLQGERMLDYSVAAKNEDWNADYHAVVGSGGKTIAALVVLKAVSDGHIQLTSTVEEILRWPRTTKKGEINGATATLDHLFSFTSGIKGIGLADIEGDGGIGGVVWNMLDYFLGNWMPSFLKNCQTIQACVAKNIEIAASCEPGNCFNYELANGGLSVAAAMVEVATGKPFNQLLQELGRELGHTSDKMYFSCMATHSCNWRNPSVAGGLFINAYEYIDFMKLMANYGEFNGKQIIKPHLIERMTFTPYLKGQLYLSGVDATKNVERFDPKWPMEGFYGFGTFLYCEDHLQYIDYTDGTLRCPIYGHGGIWGTGATLNLNNGWYAYYHTRDNIAEAGPMFQMFTWMLNEITSLHNEKCFHEGVMYDGDRLAMSADTVISPALCQRACQRRPGCESWSYREEAMPFIRSECLLLASVTQELARPDQVSPGKNLVVSGPKNCDEPITLDPMVPWQPKRRLEKDVAPRAFHDPIEDLIKVLN